MQNIVCSETNLPKDSRIKCVIKNRFIFRDVSYKVYYESNNKISSTYFKLELTNDSIQQLDKYAIGTAWYCLGVLLLTVFVYIIIVKIKKTNF